MSTRRKRAQSVQDVPGGERDDDSGSGGDSDYGDGAASRRAAASRGSTAAAAVRSDVRYIFVLLRVLGGVRMLLLVCALAMAGGYQAVFDEHGALFLAPQLCVTFFALHAAIYLTRLYAGALLATALPATVANVVHLARVGRALRQLADEATAEPEPPAAHEAARAAANEGLGWYAMFVALLVLVRHKANIRRLLTGTENKVGKRDE